MHAIIGTEALATELLAQVCSEVHFDEGSRVLYATDSSDYRQVSIGVVIPWDADDVKRAVAACRLYSAPILARGAGTSLAGQCCNVAVLPAGGGWFLVEFGNDTMQESLARARGLMEAIQRKHIPPATKLFE